MAVNARGVLVLMADHGLLMVGMRPHRPITRYMAYFAIALAVLAALSAGLIVLSDPAQIIGENQKSPPKTAQPGDRTIDWAATLRHQLTVYPSTYALPQSLLQAPWRQQSGAVPPCLRRPGAACAVFPAELTGAPPDEFLLVWPDPASTGRYDNAVLAQDGAGRWQRIGTLDRPLCLSAVEALQAGQYAIVAPVQSRYRRIETDNHDFAVTQTPPSGACQPSP